MKVHVFFSVHERLFGAIAEALRAEHGLSQLSGFVWGADQERILLEQGTALRRLTVFTRDVLDVVDDQPADIEYLSRWEQRCGIPIQHMIFAERHLVNKLSYDRLLRLTEILFKRVETDFDSMQPDAYFSEDVACLTSFVHWAVATDRRIKIIFLQNARFPESVTTYGNPFQQWDLLDQVFPDTPPGYLSERDYAQADEYLTEFRKKPPVPTGISFRSKLELGNQFDIGRLIDISRRWRVDARNPTLSPPRAVMLQRGKRLVRHYLSEMQGLFDQPVPGERFVLFPLHFQPEATTLVLAPYYMNQVALIEDIAKSLPVGYRLYVKEHRVSRGRWPLSFYRAIRRIPAVRLLGPSQDGATLVRSAAAVAVITGTMGWEALLLDKPVITFGKVFYNRYPLVFQGGELAKKDWPGLFRRAIFEYRSDPDLLRRFVACARKATSPGFTGNPSSSPVVMEPDNVRKLIEVVAARLCNGQPPHELRATN
jgi:hypothetical protein